MDRGNFDTFQSYTVTEQNTTPNYRSLASIIKTYTVNKQNIVIDLL